MPLTLFFFGSFRHYSTKVLKALHASKAIDVVGVITTPSRPAGRKKALKKTHTHLWAEKKGLHVFTPENLNPNSLRSTIHDLPSNPVDFFVVAGYGQLLPQSWLSFPKIAPLNLHFSLLPRWRGANPAEWAILSGDTQTGVTLIKMQKTIDTGPIIAQQTIPITQAVYPEGIRGDTRETLYDKLYDLAAKMITDSLPSTINDLQSIQAQPKTSPTPYARRLSRSDGFISWKTLQKAVSGQDVPQKDRPGIFSLVTGQWSMVTERAVRALSGFPGVWTKVEVRSKKYGVRKMRMKIIKAHLKNNKLILDKVQLEGKNPSTFQQIKNQLTT